jgi:hypothetical protein
LRGTLYVERRHRFDPPAHEDGESFKRRPAGLRPQAQGDETVQQLLQHLGVGDERVGTPGC